jgi:hypothetical protein
MAMRRNKLRPSYIANGWTIEKLPNSFAEQFVYQEAALDEAGYRTAQRGFPRRAM